MDSNKPDFNKLDVMFIRVPHLLKIALAQAAEADERSMSAMASRILGEWLTQKHYLHANYRKRREE